MLFYRFLLITLLNLCFTAKFSAQKSYSDQLNELNHVTFECTLDDPERAMQLSDQALIYLAKHQDQINLITQSDTYSARGSIFQQQLDYGNALINFHKSLDLRLKYKKNKTKILGMHLNIANSYYMSERNENALKYYRRGLAVADKSSDPLISLALYNGLTQVFESIGRIDSAHYYYIKSAMILEQLPDKNVQEVADYYSNIAQLHETNGMFDLAEDHLLKAIAIEQKLENYSGLAWSYHHLGIINHEKGNLSKAKSFLRKAEKLAVEQDDLETLRDVCNSWMLLYSDEGKQDSVYFFFDKAAELNTRINDKTTNEQIAVVETRYKTKQQQALLKSAQERESLLIYSGATILLVLLFLSFFLLRNYRQKQRIALLNVDLKDREINELLAKQENAAYAAMLAGQDAERLRIARELHDRLGSTLATVKLSLQNGSGIHVNENRMQLVNNAISEVREIAHDLSGSNIEQYGLFAALEELKHTIEQSGKHDVDLYLESHEIPSQLQIPIYRIVQELISNTLKHANASKLSLQLTQLNKTLQLIYEDNGCGFDPTTTASGMGLKNIRHRIEKWDGTLEIDSQLHRGTIVIISIPLTHLP